MSTTLPATIIDKALTKLDESLTKKHRNPSQKMEIRSYMFSAAYFSSLMRILYGSFDVVLCCEMHKISPVTLGRAGEKFGRAGS